MDVFENIKEILEKRGISYSVFEHEPVYTSRQAAIVRGAELKTGVKAMVLKTGEGRFVLVLVPADKRVDIGKIKELEKTKKVELASPEEVLGATGCQVGSVPPFGFRKKLKTYFEEAILENECINFNAGEHTKSIGMRSKDLADIIKSEDFKFFKN
jgi:Ala-tRNA(Pro) deacylase